jgi:hypothetical protein
VEKELELLEEYLTAEEKKRDGASGEMRTDAQERIDSLLKIAKIVWSAERDLSGKDKGKLAYVAERLLNESASAHLSVDADGKIEMMVIDSIYRSKVLARLEMKKVDDSLFLIGFRY